MKYLCTYGDHTSELPDNLDMAISYMVATIEDLQLPHWRRSALLEQARNMPRAGFSFTDNNGILISVERTA